MNKKLVMFLIILQCLGTYFIYLHIASHTTSALAVEYRDGKIDGRIEMYSKISKSGVEIPASIERPYREKHVRHFSSAPEASFFLVPAAFCVVLSLVILFEALLHKKE